MLKERYYQEAAVKANIDAIDDGQSPLNIMATGTGKTVVMARITEHLVKQGVQVLVMAHRGLLLDQFRKTLHDWTGIVADREQASQRADWRSAVILSTPSTLRGNRLLEIFPSEQTVIVPDEAHRAVVPSMMKIYEHFAPIAKSGHTATGDRPDGTPLSSVFDLIAYQYSIARGIKDGFLAKIVGRRVTDMEIDLGDLRAVGGDFRDEELADVLEGYLIPIAHNIIKETKDRRKVLIFMPNVATSEHLARILSEMGEAADYVSGAKGKANNPVFAEYHADHLKYLVSCQLLVEGYDEPGIDTVVMCRPTLSRIVYSQSVGRGTRIYPGKDHLLLLEFTFNSNKHKLVSPYELVGEDYSERIIERATDIAASGDVDFMEVLAELQVQQHDIRAIVSRAIPRDYSFQSFNPLDVGDMLGVELDKENDVWFRGRRIQGRITPKQQSLLQRFMIDTSALDRATASHLIGQIMESGAIPAHGPASPGQIDLLRRLYPESAFPMNLSKAAAGLLISKAKERT